MNTKGKILELIKHKKKVRAEDIRQKLDVSRVTIHKQLLNLQRESLIAKFGTAPKVYYQISKKKKPKTEVEKVAQKIVKHYKPEKIILFGSAATDSENKDSDLDLFIVKNTKKNFFDRLSEARRYIKSDKRVDLVVYNPQEFEDSIAKQTIFIRQVMDYGKTLYEKGNFIQSN